MSAQAETRQSRRGEKKKLGGSSRERKFQTGAERVRAGKPTATDEVVNKIRAWLSTGRIVPGQRLSEAELSRDLDVSKGPIREAMQRLVADGLIVSAPYKGYLVYRMSRSEVADVFDVMEFIDGMMARRAAENVAAGANTEDLETALAVFEEANFEIGRPAPRGDEHTLKEVLLELSGSRLVKQLSDRIYYSVFPLQFRALQSRGVPTELLDHVRRFTKAILAGDAKTAERASKAHTRALRQHLMGLSDEWFEPE